MSNSGDKGNDNSNLLKGAWDFVTGFFKQDDPNSPDGKSFDVLKLLTTAAGIFMGSKLGGNSWGWKLGLMLGLGIVGYLAKDWLKNAFNSAASGGAPAAPVKKLDPAPQFIIQNGKWAPNPSFVAPVLTNE